MTTVGPGSPRLREAWVSNKRQAMVDDVLRSSLRPGFLITGPMLVGRTTVATACAHQFTAAGGTVKWGDPSLANPDSTRDVLLVIDDVDRLASGSADRLAAVLRAQTGPRVLLTARSGAALPTAINRLIVSGMLRHRLLAPLSADETTEVLEQVLGGPVHGSLTNRVSELTEGHPFLLQAVIDGGIQGGSFSRQDGHWLATGELSVPASVGEFACIQLEALHPSAREVLEQVCLLGPLPAAAVVASDAEAALDLLEALGVIRYGWPTVDRVGPPLAGAPPALAYSVRAGLDCDRALEALCEVESGSHLDPRTRTKIAETRLDLGQPVDAAETAEAAQLSAELGEYERAARLAQDAYESGGDVGVGLLMVRTLLSVPAIDRASSALDRVRRDYPWVSPSELDLPIDGFSLGLTGPAQARLGRSLRGSTSAPADPGLVCGEASFLAVRGRPQDAIARLHEIEAAQARSDARVVLAGSQVLSGFLETDEGRPPTPFRQLNQAFQGSDDLAGRSIALVAAFERGELDGLTDEEAAWVDPQGLGRDAPHAWLHAVALGRGSLIAGRPRTAAGWYLVASESCPPEEGATWIRGLRAYALVLIGERTTADELLEAPAPPGSYTGSADRARAHAAAMDGRLDDAIRSLGQHADEAERRGLHLYEGWLRYDQVRFGCVEDRTVQRLAAIAVDGGPLAEARTEHARCVARQDPAGLVAASNALERLGARLHAAEAAGQAARLLAGADRPRDVTRVNREAWRLLLQCEGARTPAVADLSPPEPLTARELEIAGLAATGLPAKELARKLGVSWRTVDNNLYRVYAKLGIAGRAELAERLAHLGLDHHHLVGT